MRKGDDLYFLFRFRYCHLQAQHVIWSVLDGDQKKEGFTTQPNVYVIPIESVEKAIYAESQTDPHFPFSTANRSFTGPKDFHNHLQQKRIATQNEIFDYLMDRNDAIFQEIGEVLRNFLANET